MVICTETKKILTAEWLIYLKLLFCVCISSVPWLDGRYGNGSKRDHFAVEQMEIPLEQNESFMQLWRGCPFWCRFCKPRTRRKPLEIRLFRSESLSKGIEVLHPENFLGGLLLLLALPLHHPQKSLAYPDAERVQQEDEAEERMKQKFVWNQPQFHIKRSNSICIKTLEIFLNAFIPI